MLTVTLTVLALSAACLIVWFAARRSKTVQQVSSQLSGPVGQMQEQILLTADMAVERLDGKIAQMEILLSEIDRRSTILAQQSKHQQLQQLQLEQQLQQLTAWFNKQRQQQEQEFERRQQILIKMQPQQAMVSQKQLPVEQATPVEADTMMQHVPKMQEPTHFYAKGSKARMEVSPIITPPQKDKRAAILDMAEQGYSVTDIAQKMGVGKGEVLLLLKLRKKVVT